MFFLPTYCRLISPLIRRLFTFSATTGATTRSQQNQQQSFTYRHDKPITKTWTIKSSMAVARPPVILLSSSSLRAWFSTSSLQTWSHSANDFRCPRLVDGVMHGYKLSMRKGKARGDMMFYQVEWVVKGCQCRLVVCLTRCPMGCWINQVFDAPYAPGSQSVEKGRRDRIDEVAGYGGVVKVRGNYYKLGCGWKSPICFHLALHGG